MKAAPMIERPDFPLMTLTEVQSFHHMQMPRWLFFDERYSDLSLEAKVAYTFIFNRYQLSRLHGWVNDQGEVFIIYTRQALAREMQISYRKCIDCFKELVAHQLIWERRCGQGSPNQIYLAQLTDTPARTDYESAPFVTPEGEAAQLRSAESALLEEDLETPAPCGGKEEMPGMETQKCRHGTSSHAPLLVQEVPGAHTSQKEKIKTKGSATEVSQSFSQAADGGVDELLAILDGCELWVLPEEAQRPISDAVERLFFSDNYRIGPTLMPQSRIRAMLRRLDGVMLQAIYGKLITNTRPVKNSTAYIMTVVLNTISEAQGDLLVDPYLNSFRDTPGMDTGIGTSGRW